MASLNIPASSISRYVTVNVNVTGMSVYMFRWKVALCLFRLAGWITGAGLEFTFQERSRF
jgi:hypothetical protein